MSLTKLQLALIVKLNNQSLEIGHFLIIECKHNSFLVLFNRNWTLELLRETLISIKCPQPVKNIYTEKYLLVKLQHGKT